MSGVNWVQLIQGAQGDVKKELTSSALVKQPASSCPLELAEVFTRVSNGWKKIDKGHLDAFKLKTLINSPYLIKINGKYYCGDDSIWEATKDKGSRSWIHELINSTFKECLDSGLKPDHLLSLSFKTAISVWSSHKFFGGKFIDKGRSCSNQYQKSTQRS